MPKKRIEIKVSKELFDLIEKDRILKDFEDKQDLIVDYLEKKYIKTFFYKLKNLFKF